MAKITDYNEIATEIGAQLDQFANPLEDIIGRDLLVVAVAGIYLTNDVTTGYGQNFKVHPSDWPDEVSAKCSIITSPDRVSIVIDDGMSFYKSDEPICEYESLSDDIGYILLCITTAYDRIVARL